MRQLEYLEAAIAAPTWAAAAAQLGVSPSAMSQGLAELERRLGVELFARSGRRRLPTGHAAVVLTHAQRVLAQTRDVARWAAQISTGAAGQVRVGMIDIAAVHHFPDVLRAFRAERPAVALHLSVANSATLLGALRSGDLDLVVCVDQPSATSDLEVAVVATDELFVYAPPDTRVGLPSGWGPWVTFPETSHTRAVLTAALHELGAPTEVVAESNQPEVLAAMVALGVGWTVLPKVQTAQAAQPLTRARARPLAKRHLVLATRAHGMLDPAAHALRDALTPG